MSITRDALPELAGEAARLGIESALLSDRDASVSRSYDLPLIYGNEEAGHIFVLVGPEGEIKWAKDYAVPGKNPVMYVDVWELIAELTRASSEGKREPS